MKKGLVLVFFIVLTGIVVLIPHLQLNSKTKKMDVNTSTKMDLNTNEDWYNPLNSDKLVDNKELYRLDQDNMVDEIYLTILPPSNKEFVSFVDLNINVNLSNEYHVIDSFDPRVEIIFDSVNNISYSDDSYSTNGTMEIRGQSSRNSKQKSYKIKLYDDTTLWSGLKTINLNKHYGDTLRIRNKLSFDYFEMIPDFVSLRTRFVKLYIKDLASEEQDETFNYYGLYTAIEQPNKRFLKRHNLDANGHLYKAEFFEFFRYPDHIKTKESITYDENKFEEILEVSGNDNHQKLIEMLEAVNDYSSDINKVVDRYFDRDNLLTWIAVNTLFHNHDSNSRNFLLYSPLNSDKWFFIPWDYDGAWKEKKVRAKWESSISNYWGMVLFNRFFKDIKNVTALSRKIEDLTQIINEENTLKLIDSYYEVVKKSIYISPDLENLKLTESEYDEEYYSLAAYTEKNRQYYYESLENPMPFYLGEPAKEETIHKFNWSASYDLQGDKLAYTFLLSKDAEFKDVVIRYDNIEKLNCEVKKLELGKYYWKVIVYDTKGNWQVAFDYYIDENNSRFYGCKEYVVK